MSDMGNTRDYQLGDRVRIDDHRFPDFWANGAVGTIRCHPAIDELVDMVSGLHGPVKFYWVELDTPCDDAESDEPCGALSVICHALWPADA